MEQTNKEKVSELIELGKKLGLFKKDIERILKDVIHINEQPCLTLGPWWDGGGYCGGYYGTISINDF